MNCTECGGEARWVNAGRDIGQYWWCGACKKEEREWARAAPSPAPSEPLKVAWDVAVTYTRPHLAVPAPWLNLAPPLAAGDCPFCGAGAGEACDKFCFNFDDGKNSDDGLPPTDNIPF